MNKPNVNCTRCGTPVEVKNADTCFDCSTAVMLGVDGLKEHNSSVAERFTAIQSKLKECHELMDSIGSEPYIPSYRHDQMCFISDKLNNVQQNVHSLAMNLAHLG